MIPSSEAASLLLVEDDPDDVLLVRLALEMANAKVALEVVADGDAAVSYLGGTGDADGWRTPLPCLILLDLKLPRRSGHEVLEWLRRQPVLRRLPVVALTSSGQQKDIDRAYELGVNSYLVKPVQLHAFAEMLRQVVTYWTQLNRAPSSADYRDTPDRT